MSESKPQEPKPQEQEEQPGREQAMHPSPDYEPRYPGSGRLSGKVALISGGDSGIGRAVSVLFAREGASVAIIYLSEHEDAKETAELVAAEGGRALLLPGDVADVAFCQSAVNKTVEHFGGLDILINNCAEQHSVYDLTEISPEQLERTFKTNIFGYFFLTQAALPHLKRGSAIINTTSVTAYRGSKHLMDYASTRGAVVAFTRSLSSNLAEQGIRVNGVAPGPIWTPLIPASFSDEEMDNFGKKTPMKRAGQPNEVAPAFLFLACEDSSYMTGQVLHPNGGEVLNT